MKFAVGVLAAALGAGLAITAYGISPQANEHDAAPAHATTVPARRWAPDAPLREGMRRAHVAVENLGRFETGRMGAAEAVREAGAVEAAVTYMFANCKLPPEPDAALHGILVPLLTAAQVLRADPRNVKAVDEMRAAIGRYPLYFDDPGWKRPNPDATHMRD
jgi:hypothetical protein